jgi:hypothetical protein
VKKVRKPRDLYLFGHLMARCTWDLAIVQVPFYDLEDAKKLHAWLGKAIKYLERK